jgi:hypothetical protein
MENQNEDAKTFDHFLGASRDVDIITVIERELEYSK